MTSDEKRNPRSVRFFLILTSSFLLPGCAGSPHPRAVDLNGTSTSPRYLEIYQELHAATLHFPAGVYTLSAADKIGYYYRAPRKVAEHAGTGSLGREGGIFVSKRHPEKLRGYVFRAGTITHVGNFSGTKHQFVDEPLAPASQY